MRLDPIHPSNPLLGIVSAEACADSRRQHHDSFRSLPNAMTTPA
jgi:hypothetical protein